ncbi:MAG TPA: ECF-type sigma factor [Terriglobales bacterium]|jgi:RNA polymerase sigma factor (TIGR02999 family)
MNLMAEPAGDPAGVDVVAMAPSLYGELRRLAAAYMRHQPAGGVLQPTALVHEVYLRLLAQRQGEYENRAHFLGVAAHLMRLIATDHARARLAQKRGGGAPHVELQPSHRDPAACPSFLLDLDRALERLERRSPRQCQIVELRYYAGLSEAETAAALDISLRTVKRDWATAKAWLYQQLQP